MILNLLTDLTDPDNIPGGYSKIDIRLIMPLIITIIAILAIIVFACIICYLYKHSKNEEITNSKWIPYVIAIVTLALTILLIILCCIALQ